jgi:uncharacterized protein
MGLQLVAAPAAAQGGSLDEIIPPRPTGYLTDAARVVDAARADSIERLAERLRAATGAELAVVTLPTIGEREGAEVALEIGRRWGVGASADIGDPRRNAGIVLLVVPRQNGRPGTGHVRIEVGQGLEGIVTDAAAGTIQRRVMEPLLAREQYGAALAAGTRALAARIARGYGVSDTALTAYEPPPEPTREAPRVPVGFLLMLLLFFVLMSFGGGSRRRRRRGGIYWGGGPWIGGGWGGGGGFGGGFGGGGFGGFGGGGGFSGGGAGGRF